MRTKVAIMFAVVVLLGLSTCIAAEPDHNGQWWRDQDQAEKFRYAARLFDGRTVGTNLLEFGMSAQVALKPEGTSHQTSAAPRYVRFDGGELVTWINNIYADPRNMNIPVSRASVVFLHKVAGTPQGTLQSMIEEYRKPGC